MIKGSTVIMSKEFIDEIQRHIDIQRNKLSIEQDPKEKEQIQLKLTNLEKELDKAVEFQDVVVEIINIDMPRLTAIKTLNGFVLPIKNIQVL